MTSAFMEAEEPPISSDNARIAGLESQILNSQEIIVRLNRELDSALLRIATLENVCAESQNNLHEKRNRINHLTNEIDEREETNERLKQEVQEKDERLKTLDEIIVQLKHHIKQEKIEKEQRKADDKHIQCEQCQLLRNEFGENSTIIELYSQIKFDRQLSQLVLSDLGNNNESLDKSPQAIFEQHHKNEWLKFHDLLQKSLSTEDISDLIDSDDILFEPLTHINSLIRLKETLSHDSKELQHIRSLLHVQENNTNELIKDLLNKRECIEYLRTKIDRSHDFTDYDLIKHVLHYYFDFHQQQNDLKEYLRLNLDTDKDLNYSRILIERCTEAIHVGVELNQRIKSQEKTIDELTKQLDTHISEIVERRRQIDDIVSKFYDKSIDQNNNEVTQLHLIQSILEADANFRHALAAETLVTSNEDILQRVRDFKSACENHQMLVEEKHSDDDQQLKIDELTKEIHQLQEETAQRKLQLKKLISSLELDTDDEDVLFDFIQSSLRSSIEFSLLLSNQLSIKNDNESILQRIHDYQLIIDQLNSHDTMWTNETTNELINKLRTMQDAQNIVEDLQIRLKKSMNNEEQLQSDIKELRNRFLPDINHNDEELSTTPIHDFLESLTNFRQKLFDATQSNTDEDVVNIFQQYQRDHVQLQEFLNQPIQEKQDNETQTIDYTDFYDQIKELMGLETDNQEDIVNKIKELSQLPSQTVIDELLSNEEKLRNVLNIEDENLIECVTKLNENFHQLKKQHEELIEKNEEINETMKHLMNKLGLSSDLPLEKRIDEFYETIHKFSTECSQFISTDGIPIINIVDIFKRIQPILIENNRLKILIDELNTNELSEHSDCISKLQNYSTKTNNLCELICNDSSHIDLALTTYQKKILDVQNTVEKMCNFKQQLLTRLSIENEEEILDRISELKRMNSDLEEKLQTHNNTNSTVVSLNMKISEQHNAILAHEDTLEKLRVQRERMLNKMKEMKTNNETLANQLKEANESIDELHRKEIDYKNQIEEIQQQLRSANDQIQVSSDECQTQQELQETMKLEIQSIKNEIETQRKLYESRCRQIIHEKNQLDKNQKETFEQKQILENENKRLQSILQTIKDTLENVDDVDSIVDTILKLRQDHLTFINEQNRRYEHVHTENQQLLLNIQQQQVTIHEYTKIKDVLEKRLFDNEQHTIHLKKELQEKINEYQRLEEEFQSYKEEYSFKSINSQVAVIDIEPSPPSPMQQTVESNHWTTIEVKDDQIPLAAVNKHPVVDLQTALFNLLGELKSKLGITLTHRPRSSSVFFFYLWAIHLLTLYLLFIRRC